MQQNSFCTFVCIKSKCLFGFFGFLYSIHVLYYYFFAVQNGIKMASSLQFQNKIFFFSLNTCAVIRVFECRQIFTSIRLYIHLLVRQQRKKVVTFNSKSFYGSSSFYTLCVSWFLKLNANSNKRRTIIFVRPIK